MASEESRRFREAMEKKRQEYIRRVKETGRGRAAEDVMARFKAMDPARRDDARRLLFVLLMDVARDNDAFMHGLIVALLAGELSKEDSGLLTVKEFNRIFALVPDESGAELAETIVTMGMGEAAEFAKRIKQLDGFMEGTGSLEDLAQLQRVINKWLTGESLT